MRAAFGREGKHRYPGLRANQRATGIRRSDRDLGQLRRAWFDHDAAVGKDHGAVVTGALIAQSHQKETGHQLESGAHADAVQGRAHRMRRRICRAGN